MPDHNLVELQDAATKQFNKTKQRLCAGAICELKHHFELASTPPYRPEFIYKGCPNDRRHGSKWCQACSDAHNAK